MIEEYEGSGFDIEPAFEGRLVLSQLPIHGLSRSHVSLEFVLYNSC